MAKIAIVIPNNYPIWNKQFIMSLLGLIVNFYEKIHPKHRINILIQNAGIGIADLRERLVDTALKGDYDYLLWLDTDQTFMPDMIGKMIDSFEKDGKLEAVTGIYCWRQPPYLPHVYSRYNKKTGKFRVAGAFPTNEPFIVAGAGYGCLMIKTSVYRRVEKPWFIMETEGDNIKVGEDLYFFKKAQPIKMICDPTIISGHLVENSVDFSSFLWYNGIKIEDGKMIVSDERLKEISDEHVGNLERKI